MKRYFFDTSALVKIYHREAGSDFCLACYADQSPLVISELARVKLHSAVYRKHREKELNAKALNALIQRFEFDCEERYEILHVASLVYDEACRLLVCYAGTHGLRTLDSLQLATFLTYCEKEQGIFACADRKLTEVAEQESVKAVYV